MQWIRVTGDCVLPENDQEVSVIVGHSKKPVAAKFMTNLMLGNRWYIYKNSVMVQNVTWYHVLPEPPK